MRASSTVLGDRAIPVLGEQPIRPTPKIAGDPAAVPVSLDRDRDRIARDLNGRTVPRLFSAGQALQTALGLMPGHPGAGKVQQAIDELELAIRDIRDVQFDGHQAVPPSGRRLG
jgi:hypothetical protein